MERLTKITTILTIILFTAAVSISVVLLFGKEEPQIQKEIVKEIVIEEGERGEEGPSGSQGPRGKEGEKGEIGEKGSLPEGHWQSYCLYPNDEFGYPTNDILKRDDGDCPDWRKVDLWER